MKIKIKIGTPPIFFIFSSKQKKIGGVPIFIQGSCSSKDRPENNPYFLNSCGINSPIFASATPITSSAAP